VAEIIAAENSNTLSGEIACPPEYEDITSQRLKVLSIGATFHGPARRALLVLHTKFTFDNRIVHMRRAARNRARWAGTSGLAHRSRRSAPAVGWAGM